MGCGFASGPRKEFWGSRSGWSLLHNGKNKGIKRSVCKCEKKVCCLGRQQTAREHQASHQKGQRLGTKKTWAELGAGSWELSKMKVVRLFNNCWCWFLLCLLGLLHPPLLAALAGHKLGLGEKCPKRWAFLSGCIQTHLCLCLRAQRHIYRSCWKEEILSEWLL